MGPRHAVAWQARSQHGRTAGQATGSARQLAGRLAVGHSSMGQFSTPVGRQTGGMHASPQQAKQLTVTPVVPSPIS